MRPSGANKQRLATTNYAAGTHSVGGRIDVCTGEGLVLAQAEPAEGTEATVQARQASLAHDRLDHQHATLQRRLCLSTPQRDLLVGAVFQQAVVQ